MIRYISGLIAQRIITLFFIALITFSLMHAVPGGPFAAQAGERLVSPEFIQQQRDFYGLDDPIPQQFGNWLWHMVQGDMGLSFSQLGRSVEDILLDGLKPSAILGAMAFAIVMGIGIPLGVISAIRANTRFDYASVGISTIFGAVPSFILAFLLLLIFTVWLDVFPVRLGKGFGDSFGSLKNGILPAIALGGPAMAIVTRLTRGAMLEVLSEDYIRTARAKGLSSRSVYLRHGLRNALVPILTLAGPIFAFLITGSIIIENIFGLPGIGNAFVASIFSRDFGMIMGTTMFFATLIVFMNLLVDLTYPFLDPRVKLGHRG